MFRVSIILSSFLLFNFSCFAQNPFAFKKKIGVHYSLLGANNIFTFQSVEGSASYSNKGTFNIGFNLERPISDQLYFTWGVDFTKHDFIVEPAFMGENTPASQKGSIHMLSIPILLKTTFGRYFYTNGGALIDLDISKTKLADNQTGIGVSIGLGGQYIFKSGVGLILEPTLKLHSLVPFNLSRYHSRLLESGIKVGLTYQIQ